MSDTVIFFQRWNEGRVDARNAIEVQAFDGARRTAEEALADLARFRGEMLSRTYSLEHQLEALILWRLFGTHFDAAAAFFDEHIMGSGAFSLQLKTKLGVLIVQEWDFLEEVDVEAAVRRLKDSKARRDRVAHWPVELLPVRLPDGETVDFVPVMSKGRESFRLTSDEQATWLREIDEVETNLREISRHIFRHARDFPEG